MIDEDEEGEVVIKIIDFGSAFQVKNKEEVMQNIHGLFFYTAPEVFENQYKLNCDMWSVGVITFVLLTGRFPYDGNSPE